MGGGGRVKRRMGMMEICTEFSTKKTGEMAQCPRVVATLVVDPGSVPSLCVRAKSCS